LCGAAETAGIITNRRKEICFMTHLFRTSVILASVFTLCVVAQGRALAAEAECRSNLTQVKALSSGPQHTEVNFNTDINAVPDATGYFDPAPLLSTTIDVDGGKSRVSCLIAHLSVEVAPLDTTSCSRFWWTACR